MRAQRLVVLAGALAVLAVAASPSQAYVYWSDYASQGISRAALDGTGASPLYVAALDANSPDGLASDGTHLFWSTAGGTGTYGTLGRATLAGGLVEPSWLAPSGGVGRGMALDATHVWWVRGSGGGSDGSIARAGIDGSAPNVAFVGAAAFPTGVARDGAWVYWTESVSLKLGRARASDGGEVIQTAATGMTAPTGIAARDGWVYWSNASTNTIGRARGDGASPNAFSQVDPSFITGAATPLAVATDATYLYWANSANGTIGRAKLDGTAVQQSFIAGAGQPAAIAVDALGPQPVTPPGDGDSQTPSQPVQQQPQQPATSPASAPVLSGLALTPRSFRAAAKGASLAKARRAPVGAALGFRLSAAGQVGFTVERLLPGRRVAGRCVAPTTRNRRARACTRSTSLKGSFTAAGAAGANRLRFTGRLAGRALTPGSYALVSTPSAGGTTGTAARARFAIVR